MPLDIPLSRGIVVIEYGKINVRQRIREMIHRNGADTPAVDQKDRLGGLRMNGVFRFDSVKPIATLKIIGDNVAEVRHCHCYFISIQIDIAVGSNESTSS